MVRANWEQATLRDSVDSVVCCWATAIGGCSLAGEGDLEIRVSAEQAAMVGLPNLADRDEEHEHSDSEGDAPEELHFVDGWVIDYDKYIVSIGDIEIANSEGDRRSTENDAFVVDLAQAEPAIEVLRDVPGSRWDVFSFSVRPPDDEDVVATQGDVSDEDLDRMIDERLNYWVEDRASKGDVEVRFAWGVQNATRNEACTNGVDDTAGVVLRNNSMAVAEITLHIEHMFWDTLGSEQTRLRFDAIAAMADDEGMVSFEALADQRLADLRDADGQPLLDSDGSLLFYDAGSAPLAEQNLSEFIRATMRSQAHLNGAGLCTIDGL